MTNYIIIAEQGSIAIHEDKTIKDRTIKDKTIKDKTIRGDYEMKSGRIYRRAESS